MPSPDLSQYHDLTVYDKEASDLIARALADAAVKLPGWTPREANTEVLLIETLALMLSEMIFAVNRLPDAIVEVLMRLFGITRLLGAPGVGSATFQLSDNLGHTIPAGTRTRMTISNPADPSEGTVDFKTTGALVVPPGSTAGTIGITSVRNTDAANAAPIGTPLTIVDAVPFIESAAVAVAPIGSGAPPEADEAWRSRAVTQFAALTSTLVLARDFEATALQWPSVYRAKAIDQWDPTLGGGAGGAANGHITVFVLGYNDGLLTAGDKTALQASLDAKALGALAVHVVDPTITAVAVTVTAKAAAGYATADVQTAVIAALDAYLSPSGWPWAATVRVNELISLVDSVAGVDYVVSVTAPAADLPLTGAAPLANLGTTTVTIT